MAPKSGRMEQGRESERGRHSSHFTPTTRAREAEASEVPWTCQPHERLQLGASPAPAPLPPSHGLRATEWGR